MTAPQSRPGVAFPVGATHPTPDVVTWLDERTEAELQPPCEITGRTIDDLRDRATLRLIRRTVTNWEPCGKPAAWVATTRCGCLHGPDRRLCCLTHLGELCSTSPVCDVCSRPIAVVAVEPLR